MPVLPVGESDDAIIPDIKIMALHALLNLSVEEKNQPLLCELALEHLVWIVEGKVYGDTEVGWSGQIRIGYSITAAAATNTTNTTTTTTATTTTAAGPPPPSTFTSLHFRLPPTQQVVGKWGKINSTPHASCLVLLLFLMMMI